ncbi:hypothetical protein BDQ12DRAFT_683567 [Crucibulum laeve]|uniref:DUF6533 domain-containing protein n=1 Tax=Crucibulum laeve TaxID=68775 RepID=A0A5C3M2L1_9AGAR|nr:hypothetical protein BDQ12DRAFT_683567 [Crucibulum laeve]
MEYENVSLTAIIPSRFVDAAGLIVLLYDHILSFADEVEYIWGAKWTAPKFLFLLVRYAVPSGLLLHTYQISGISNITLSNGFCKMVFAMTSNLGLVTIGVGNFLVLLRLWLIWNRARRLVCWTLCLFIGTQVATVGCAVAVMINVGPSVRFNEDLNMCQISRRGFVSALYTPALIFEGIAMVIVCWNALDRPRRYYGDIIDSLCRDGFGYVGLLFGLRLANLLVTIFVPLHLVFPSICFVWALTTVTVTRLILKLRKTARFRQDLQKEKQEVMQNINALHVQLEAAL